jgi:hypothetical protein
MLTKFFVLLKRVWRIGGTGRGEQRWMISQC